MSCDCNTLIVGEAGPQGPQGLSGTNGTNGTNGINAFTTLSASFTQPSVSGNVSITVGTNQWMAIGQTIYISQAGFYIVGSLVSTTGVTCSLIQTDGISPASTVSSGRKISPAAVITSAATLTSLTVNGSSSLDGALVVNDSGADRDVRVEGDTDANLFTTDASADRVGVGIAVPETKFHVAGSLKVGTAASGADAVFTQAVTVNNNQSSSGNLYVKGASLDPVLFVNASSNRVGIGTASPTAVLDIVGAAKVSGDFAVDTNVLFVDTANNRIGVNKSAPSYSVDISGTANVSGSTTIGGSLGVTGTCTVAAVNASGNLAVDTSVLFVNVSTNRVGVNTATPATDLDVTGTVNVNGTIQRNAPVTKTTDFTLASSENWLIVNNSSGATTATFPAASSWTGREVMIKTTQAQAVNSASSNIVPLIGGSASTAILTGTAGKWATLVSDGTSWVIMAGN